MSKVVVAVVVLGSLASWLLLNPRNSAESFRKSGRADVVGGASGKAEDPERLAEQFFFRGEYERAVELFRVLVIDRPDDGLLWARYAFATHELGQFEAALPLHERAAGFEENRVNSLFKLGCALARLGRAEEALDALQRSVEFGYRDRSWAEQEPDLSALAATSASSGS